MLEHMAGLIVLLLAVQSSATQPPAEAEVTVTARPLSALRADWQACIDRGCPPKVEMARAMAYAEGQLVGGDYTGSWRTLRTTKRRNLKHADDLPLDVAQIARASARMADLNGEARIGRVNAFETIDALRAGLKSEDDRILLAKLDIGDAYLPERQFDFALAQYRRVEKEARKRGLAELAVEAAYRRTALLVALAEQDGSYRMVARKAAAAIANSTEPAAAPYRDVARLTAINLLPRADRERATLAILPTLAPRPPGNLLLILSPPIPVERLVANAPPRNAAQQWADIRYRIAPDGTVHDAEPVRQSPHLDPALRDAAVGAVGARRYAPLALASGDPGLVRYARYTFIADTPDKVGTRIPTRSEVPRVDVFDLGADLARRD